MKLKNILIAVVAVIIIIVIGFIGWYSIGKKAVNKEKNKEIISVEISEGMGASSIATLLESKNVIKNADVMKIYIKLNKKIILQAGKYELDNSENLEKIISHISNGDVANASIKLTFIEGKNMRNYAKVIADNTNNTEEDVFELLENEEYIDSLIEKYWFITDCVKNEDIYYSLEGYLCPDTYLIESEDVSVEEIFEMMLDNMEDFLDEHKDEIKYDINELFTLASMAELEGVSYEDRQEIVGVFVNRMKKNMALGSDVTTYYAVKVDMGERDLYQKELDTENPYNTRGPNMAGKLPVGPICNPSKDALLAAFNFTETDNLYFVADKNRKVYFSKTNDEHNSTIQKLKKDGLWYTY